MSTIYCTGCEKDLPRENFYASLKLVNQGKCKICHNAYTKAYRAGRVRPQPRKPGRKRKYPRPETIQDGVPDGSRRCNRCRETKLLKDFGKSRYGFQGLAEACRQCRWPTKSDSKRHQLTWTQEERLAAFLVTSSRSRAKVKNVEHTIEMTDLLPIPKKCPVFGTPLALVDAHVTRSKGRGTRAEDSISIDRVDSSRGYVPGNVVLMSWRANRIKNNGTAEEHRLIAEWMELHEICA